MAAVGAASGHARGSADHPQSLPRRDLHLRRAAEADEPLLLQRRQPGVDPGSAARLDRHEPDRAADAAGGARPGARGAADSFRRAGSRSRHPVRAVRQGCRRGRHGTVASSCSCPSASTPRLTSTDRTSSSSSPGPRSSSQAAERGRSTAHCKARHRGTSRGRHDSRRSGRRALDRRARRSKVASATALGSFAVVTAGDRGRESGGCSAATRATHRRAQRSRHRATAPSARPPSGAAAKGTAIGLASAVPVGGAREFTDPAQGIPAYVVRPSEDSYVAFSAVCTHMGCTVGFFQPALQFRCPCHGSIFSAATGEVLQGPADVAASRHPHREIRRHTPRRRIEILAWQLAGMLTVQWLILSSMFTVCNLSPGCHRW